MNRIWITWEKQRRSIELSKSFQAKYFELLKFSYQISNPIFRYSVLSYKTIKILFKERPETVFCQNPSIILATLLCFAKAFLKYNFIVDRHSNFKFDKNKKLFKYRMFNLLSDFTIRIADLTIITNKYLYNIVKLKGGKGFVLEDKLPLLNKFKKFKLEGEKAITFISSFSEDEPIFKVIEAAKRINRKWTLYITGKCDMFFSETKIRNNLPNNIKFTGYLKEEDYQSLIKSSNVIMVLTNMEHTLTCGAYEGISLEKPLILSDTYAIKNYFFRGAIYTQNSEDSIRDAIYKSIYNESILVEEIKELKKSIEIDWKIKFQKLSMIIDKMEKSANTS